MEAPSNLKQLQGFVGMVNFYHDMWPHQAHILAPLTVKPCAPKKGVKQPKFVWTEDMQTAFQRMKAMTRKRSGWPLGSKTGQTENGTVPLALGCPCSQTGWMVPACWRTNGEITSASGTTIHRWICPPPAMAAGLRWRSNTHSRAKLAALSISGMMM